MISFRLVRKPEFTAGRSERASEVYEIPDGEINVDDPNDALTDFARECNIKILAAYQGLMLK